MSILHRPELPRPISDLAAGLTDVALEVLHRAGVRGDSVEMELRIWHLLTEEISHEFEIFESRPSSDNAILLGPVIEQALHRTAVRIAYAFDQGGSSSAIETRIRSRFALLPLTGDRHLDLTNVSPHTPANRRPLGQSGIVRRLQVTSLN